MYKGIRSFEIEHQLDIEENYCHFIPFIEILTELASKTN